MLNLKLKIQYLGHLMRTADSLEKFLMLGKIEGRGEEGESALYVSGFLREKKGHLNGADQ